MSEVAHWVDDFFAGRSPVHKAMSRLSCELGVLNIPFAIGGAMALNAHGFRRGTEDVDILIRREDLRIFKEHWLGRGWVEVFPGSKAMRDTIHNVKIDVLIPGEFPGDGKPKPVAFPDPREASEAGPDGIPVLTLEKLLELKLASGMTAPHRLRDLADVIELIKARELPEEFAERLHPYVQPKYRELWPAAQVVEDY